METLTKARKPKGLGNWQKLDYLKDRVDGKQAADITFSCSHPSHEGAAVKHVLGSTVGNLHFLQGYGNPNFYLADYHWMIIDPEATPEDVSEWEHPSKPEYWSKSGLPAEKEGDLAEGTPHEGFKESEARASLKESLLGEIVRTESGMGMYLGIPSKGLVYGLHNGMVYKWGLLKNSYFAYSKPNFAAAMNSMEDQPVGYEETDDSAVPVTKALFDRVSFYQGDSFDESVYPIVKGFFPVPGSLVHIEEDVWGVVTKKSLDFVNLNGDDIEVEIYDTAYKSISLIEDDYIHPSIIMNLVKSLNIDYSENEQTHVRGLASEHLRGELDG